MAFWLYLFHSWGRWFLGLVTRDPMVAMVGPPIEVPEMAMILVGSIHPIPSVHTFHSPYLNEIMGFCSGISVHSIGMGWNGGVCCNYERGMRLVGWNDGMME